MNFDTVELGTIISHRKGLAFKSKDYKSTGHPVVRVSNFTSDSISTSDLKFVSDEIASQSKTVELRALDIVISTVGSWPSNPASIVGKTIMVPEALNGALLNQNSVRLRVLSDSLVDQEYLFYALKNQEFSDYLVSTAQGSANQASITIKDILKYQVPWPEESVRKNITSIIGNVRKKIELNTQTNQTLEQIAQAIFKSWFVDFDPVKAKIETLAAGGSADDAELAAMSVISAKTLDELNSLKANNSEAFNKLAQTAALFPAAMQDSELGEIPEGWSYCTFGDISACFDSKRVPLSKRKREEKQPGTIPYYGATSVMDYVNEWIFDDTYLLLGEDGSVVKDDGTPFVQYIWGKSWVNNHAHVLQGNNGVSTEHLMVFIKGTNIASYVTGAVQLKLNQKNMNSIPFLKASTEINLVFQGVLNGLYDAYKNNIESSQSLSSLRDSLLPRLLSGEMELKDKE